MNKKGILWRIIIILMRIVAMPALSSLAAPKVVGMPTFSDDGVDGVSIVAALGCSTINTWFDDTIPTAQKCNISCKCKCKSARYALGRLGPLLLSYCIHYNLWHEIIKPYPNLNGATVEVWKWTSDFIQYFTGPVIIYPCCIIFIIC